MKKLWHHAKNTIHPAVLDFSVLGLGLVIFATLVLQKLSYWSIWFDEAYSWYITKFSFSDIAHYTASDVHPPLYYWLLKIWEMLFGTSELALRSLSLLFALAAISAGFVLVRKLFGRKAAWVSLLLMILSPMLIRYSQEARMYTLVTAICTFDTYVLVKVTETTDTRKRRRWLALYGFLLAMGMWTNYFSALVWLAHWVWRGWSVAQVSSTFKTWFKTFFNREWLLVHVFAIILFAPWIPFMITQLSGIQHSGFWIGAVGADTLTNYLTNIFFYQEHWQLQPLLALLLILLIIIVVTYSVSLYRKLETKQKSYYVLVLCVSIVPVVLLFLGSLPPLKSSFVERYLLSAVLGLMLFVGVTLALGVTKFKKTGRIISIGLVVVALCFGVSQVLIRGNYNNNSRYLPNTKQLMQQIAHSSPAGVPVIADSPYLYYELSFYATKDHPVYYLYSDSLKDVGSTLMLYKNSDFAINSLQQFTKDHPVIWWATGNRGVDISAPQGYDWSTMQSTEVYDATNNDTVYHAKEFATTKP
jgi:mannosyltransferase